MRILLLLLFVGTLVLADEKAVKPVDGEKVSEATKGAKKTVVNANSGDGKKKTEKRDSSDQTGSFFSNLNNEPFRPIIGIGNSDIYEAAAASHQATYYDKNQLTSANEAVAGGSRHQQQQEQFTALDALATKDATNINRKAVGAGYQGPYSQEVYQHQPQSLQHHPLQEHQLKHSFAHNDVKNNANQLKNILYAQSPPADAYNYEHVPGQQQHQQQNLRQQIPGKDIQNQQVQYVIAIPMSYLRQLQQQLLQPQHASNTQHNQVEGLKAAQQKAPQSLGDRSNAGPLARDHQGAYRPFHRFAPLAVNAGASINADGHYNLQHAPAPPGYVTQYIQIPASVLLQAAQSAQVYQSPAQQQHQIAYGQQQQSQQQPQQQHQQQAHDSPQFYNFYAPQQQAELRHPQQQLKQLPASPVLLPPPPPSYAYQIQPQPALHYFQQPLQPHPHNLHSEAQLQQLNVGKQQHQQLRGDGATAPYPHHEHLVSYAPQPTPTLQHTNAHSQPAPSALDHNHQHKQHNPQQPPPQAPQVLTNPQAPKLATISHSPPAARPGYEPIVHYNPQYLVHYLQPQQLKHLKYQQSAQPLHQFQLLHGQHQAQAPSHGQHQSTLGNHFNNIPYSQGIQGPTPPPYLRLQPAAPAVAPAVMNPYSFVHPFAASGLQPSFPPLGTPSKVTSFSNVLLQPFVGHPHAHAAYQPAEIGAMANAMPYFNHVGGIHYGTHLFHPATPGTPLTVKQDGHAVHLPAGAAPVSAKSSVKGASAKTTEGNIRSIVKYP